MKIHPSFFLFAIIALLSCQSIDGIISFPGVVKNPDDCTNDETICTSKGMVCDQKTKQCFNGACIANASCPMPTATVCTSNTCVPCGTDMDCASWTSARNENPKRNYCSIITQASTCAECRPVTGSADCDQAGLKPVCDTGTGLCRACRADSECASGICRKAGDYPLVPPIQDLKDGQCVPSNKIAYVDKDGVNAQCSDGNPGTKIMPYCTVAKAISTNQQPYIYVAPSQQGNYPPVSVSGGSFVIVGPGRSTPTAIFDQLDVTGGTLVLSGAQVMTSASIANPNFSTRCGPNGRLYLLNTQIQSAVGRGVDAYQDCLQVVVERSLIRALRWGIVVGVATSSSANPPPKVTYRIVNTAVVQSGASIAPVEPHGINLGSLASGFFAFNTVTRNQAGISCNGLQPIYNSIIMANSPGGDVGGCITTGNQIVTANAVLDTTGPEPMLLNDQSNDLCCVDKALPPMGSEVVNTDYYGHPRPAPNPSGGGYDIGFHELK